MIDRFTEEIDGLRVNIGGLLFVKFVAPVHAARIMTLNLQRRVSARVGSDKLQRICGEIREPLMRSMAALCNDRSRHD